MIKKIFSLLLVTITIGSCSKKQPTHLTLDNDQQIKSVGILLPLSGRYKTIGMRMLMGAKLAIKNNQNIKLIIEDTKGTPNDTVLAYNRLKKQKVKLILGPLLAACVRKISLLDTSIPIISYSSTSKVTKSGFYLLGQNLENQITHIFKFALQSGRYNFTPPSQFSIETEYDNQNTLQQKPEKPSEYLPTVLAILPDNEYGLTINRYLEQNQGELGFNLDKSIFFTNNQQEFATATSDYQYPDLDPKNLTANNNVENTQDIDEREEVAPYEVNDAEFIDNQKLLPEKIIDIIFIPMGGKKLKVILNSLVFHNVITQEMINKNRLTHKSQDDEYPRPILLLGTNRWMNQHSLNNSFLSGGLFSAPIDNTKQIKQDFKNYFNSDVDSITLMCIDSIKIAQQFLNSGQQRLDEMIFNTTQGPCKFEKNGSAKRNLYVYKVGINKFKMIN